MGSLNGFDLVKYLLDCFIFPCGVDFEVLFSLCLQQSIENISFKYFSGYPKPL